VTFELDLAGSTFGAVPWVDGGPPAPGSCDAGPIDEIPRIATCPTLVAGVNSAFPSGGHDRTFEVVLPASYDPGGSYPLILVYHGFGGSPADMLDASGLRPYADDRDVILIAPQAEEEGGSPIWDAFSPPETNLDAVLFDDLVTCARASFAVDPDRIHVTGMSNGGLMTGSLMATRSEVIASAAPMSGGVGIEGTDTGYAMPALVIWGGASDVAFDQDFNLLANEMIDRFVANDQFVVGCDHGLGHTLDPSFWPWVTEFLLDHPRDLTSEPYAAALPGDFPPYCSIR
jgi:predicted esterase